jgi:hypothetical protein
MIWTRANRIDGVRAGREFDLTMRLGTRVLNLTEVVYGCSPKDRTAVLTAL